MRCRICGGSIVGGDSFSKCNCHGKIEQSSTTATEAIASRSEDQNSTIGYIMSGAKFCGLTVSQVLTLKYYYEARTGKKAEDIK